MDKLEDLINLCSNELIIESPDSWLVLWSLITEILEMIDHACEDPEKRSILLIDADYIGILDKLFQKKLFESHNKLWKASWESIWTISSLQPQVNISIMSSIIDQLWNELSESRSTNLHSLIALKYIISNEWESEEELRERIL